MKPLRVLLASPSDGVDPFCGDVIYTRSLVASPPDGVTYVTYPQALASGELLEHGRRSALAQRSGPVSMAQGALLVREGIVNRLRGHGMLYREPFRHWEVCGTFDLIHCHTFSARWTGRATPVIFSNALPITELYRHARGWSAFRVAASDLADRSIARATGVSHVQRPDEQIERVIAFTEALASWYSTVAGWPGTRIGVVPCFPDGLAPLQRRRALLVPGRIGFVAKDFEAKGGPAVMDALRQVRRERPDAHLVIVGSPPRLSADDCERQGVTWLPEIPRPTLLNELLPSMDALAYPSRMDGLPLIVLEALGSGVPCVVSNYFALPEVVREGAGKVVRLDGGPGALADALLEVIAPQRREEASRAARARYEGCYSPEVVLPRLRREYDLATGAEQSM